MTETAENSFLLRFEHLRIQILYLFRASGFVFPKLLCASVVNFNQASLGRYNEE